MLISEITTQTILAETSEVTFAWGKLFVKSYIEMKTKYPNLDKKYDEFIKIKSANIRDNYGTHDYALVGILAGFKHCHLAPDAILIYRVKDKTVEMLFMCQHDDMKQKNAKRLANKLS
jgi:mRNA-degrading endonuclease YafQ of YafQ-DinJ toxin-antitoxin module